jgi:xanthine dehydrogenase/oxidase
MTGSPISDLNPILMAAGTLLTVQSVAGGRRLVPFDANFYTGYRRNVIRPEEVLVNISLPFPTSAYQFFVAYKQARRRDDDIAIVNAAFNLTVETNSDGWRIGALRMAFGGMAPTTVLAERTAAHLLGQQIGAADDNLVETACRLLTEELALAPAAPGAMIRYRRSLVLGFFFKFYLEVRRELGMPLPPGHVSATQRFVKPELHSHQLFEIRDTAVADMSSPASKSPGWLPSLGRPIKHKAADYQVAGTARYTDDMAKQEGELYMGLVLSQRAHARILQVKDY